MAPASSSSLSRFDNRAGDMRGTPGGLISLKRCDLHRSSRMTSAVQREQKISAPIATGQNWP